MTNFLYQICFIVLMWSDHFPGYDAVPIQGGQHDENNEAIWQVSYQVKRSDGTWQHVCGGSIISSQNIVTAAHCFIGLGRGNINFWDRVKREKTRIIIGTNDLTPRAKFGVMLKIDKVIIPKAYSRLEDGTLLADIAVIKPRGRVDLSKNREIYGPIDLFDPKNETERKKYDDQEGFISGFGAVRVTCIREDGNASFSYDGLRKILPLYFTDYKCPQVRGLRCVKYMNTSEEPQGWSVGDSGGPLYYRNGNGFELVGIMSRSPISCDMRESSKGIGKVMFIPDYKDFLDRAKILNTETIFPEISVEEFKHSDVDYVVLPDQSVLARSYYVKPIENKEKKRPCPSCK